jgi:hypothetical protein
LKDNSIRLLKSGVNYDETIKYFSIPMFFICGHLRVGRIFQSYGQIASILEAHEQCVVAIIDRKQSGAILPDAFLDGGAVDVLRNPPSQKIVERFDRPY